VGILSQDDWSLDRRGQAAQARHREKVREAIRNNLPNLISDQGFILSDGKRTVRIPVQSLDEPHFVYDQGKQSRVGQGEGRTGQSIGSAQDAQAGNAPGAGGAGQQPGERMIESEVSLDEVEEVLFAGLELPNLEDKRTFEQQAEASDFSDIRPKGMLGNLDRRHTLLEALRRSRKQGKEVSIQTDDLRYKTWEDSPRPDVAAVVIAMMDVSGSMGMTEKYMSRTFFYWLERFLKSKYEHVNFRYLVHHVVAYETGKEEFYTTRESGGTVCSSVFQAALDLIRKDYPPQAWNIYPVYVGDGDNLVSDNERARALLENLCEASSLVGYMEVNLMHRPASLISVLGGISPFHFRAAAVSERKQVLEALQTFFRPEAIS